MLRAMACGSPGGGSFVLEQFNLTQDRADRVAVSQGVFRFDLKALDEGHSRGSEADGKGDYEQDYELREPAACAGSIYLREWLRIGNRSG